MQATPPNGQRVACDYCGREVTAGICAELTEAADELENLVPILAYHVGCAVTFAAALTEAADQLVATALRRAPNTDKE